MGDTAGFKIWDVGDCQTDSSIKMCIGKRFVRTRFVLFHQRRGALSATRDAEDAEKISKYQDENLTHTIIAAAIEVHRALGPGLLESAYKACLKK